MYMYIKIYLIFFQMMYTTLYKVTIDSFLNYQIYHIFSRSIFPYLLLIKFTNISLALNIKYLFIIHRFLYNLKIKNKKYEV